MRKIINKILSILLIPVAFLFMLSFSIFIPTIDREFYFMQVGPLNIVKNSGFSLERIQNAFNDVMDFMWKNAPFKTGDLHFSSECQSHFEDCKVLFVLNLIILIISALVLLTILILTLTKVIKIERFFGFSPLFFSGISLIVFLIGVTIFGLIDFDKLFEVFHHVFFPGKDNWLFDPSVDEIIRILPEDYFMNCAILIGSISGTLSVACIIYSVIVKIKLKRKNNK